MPRYSSLIKIKPSGTNNAQIGEKKYFKTSRIRALKTKPIALIATIKAGDLFPYSARLDEQVYLPRKLVLLICFEMYFF